METGIGSSTELSKTELEIAKLVGQKRHRHNMNVGAKTTMYNNKGSEENHIEAMEGELAFCKIFNVYPDLTTDRFGSYDAVLPTHDFIDVKTKQSQYDEAIMFVKETDKKRAVDFFSLMVKKNDLFVFKGFMLAREVMVPRRLKQYSSKCWEVNEKELYWIDIPWPYYGG